MKKAWEKIKAAWIWAKKNRENIAGTILCALGSGVLMYSCTVFLSEKSKPEAERPVKERTTVRQDVSALWHHAACLVKFCDEDGRCPVWSSEYSKCYMLDNGAKEFLLEFQKETKKETFEEVFVK